MPSRLVPLTLITLLAVAFMWVTRSKDEPTPKDEIPTLSAAELKATWSPHKLVFINFWATWCEPCQKEIPDLVRLQKAFVGRGLHLTLINLEGQDKAPEVLKFLTTTEATPWAYQKPAKTQTFFSDLGFEAPAGLPLSGLWTPEKGLIKSWAGAKTYEELELEVRGILE